MIINIVIIVYIIIFIVPNWQWRYNNLIFLYNNYIRQKFKWYFKIFKILSARSRRGRCQMKNRVPLLGLSKEDKRWILDSLNDPTNSCRSSRSPDVPSLPGPIPCSRVRNSASQHHARGCAALLHLVFWLSKLIFFHKYIFIRQFFKFLTTITHLHWKWIYLYTI